MKSLITLTVLSMMLFSCASYHTEVFKSEKLANQHFLLTSVNGQIIPAGKPTPDIWFNKELGISGKMCNRFIGQGVLSSDVLVVKHMAMTMMMCTDAQRNELDRTIRTMLSEGARVNVVDNKLTLTTSSQALIYTRAVKVF